MPRKLITIPGFRKGYHTLSDEQLLARFRKQGDEEIIAEFFNRYMHLIYAICYSYIHDDDITKDVVMEVFESLGEKIHAYDIHNFKSWLNRVARNTCLMRIRKQKPEVSLELLSGNRKIVMENQADLHPSNEEADLFKSLHIFLNRLKKDQRQCLELMYFKDMSYKDISSATGYSLKQVKSYIQNGKRNLRGLLGNELVK